jgi:signal transduction histidine kinase
MTSAPTRRVRPREAGIPVLLPIFTLLIATGVALLSLSQALTWRGQPFLGALFTQTLIVDGTTPIAENWAAFEAGLARGDQIISIDGVAVADAAAALGVIANAQIGDVLTVGFVRPADSAALPLASSECPSALADGSRECAVDVRLTRFPDGDFIALFVIPFLSGVVALAIGVGVLWARWRVVHTRWIALTTSLMAIFLIGLFDLNTSYLVAPIWVVASVFLGAAVLGLAIYFPMKLGIFYRRPWLPWVPPLTTLFGTLLALWLYFGAPFSTAPLTAFRLGTLSVMIGTLLACIIWMRQRQRATMPLYRDQANLAMLGFFFALAPAFIYFINIFVRPVSGVDLIPLNTSAIAPFFMLPAFSMAYAGLQTRAIDADVWMSRGITYTFLAVALILGYFLLVFVGTMVLTDMAPNNPVIIAVAIFVVAVAFVPLRTRLQAQVDKLYFRRRINYQDQVEAFARSISALRALPGITNEYRAKLENTIAPTHSVIFLHNPLSDDYSAFGAPAPQTDIRFGGDSPLVAHLREHEGLITLDGHIPWADAMIAERARLLVLKPALLVGFRGSSRLNGFAIIGTPRSGASQYNYDEQRFIENLSNQMTVAVERAQVVESLQRRVKELDILSKVSQAVNFTGDFDQLLELISAQIVRLIETSHVYIALRDAAMNELYYAFFQENDERFPNKENQRWTIASDLVSEVARNGQSLRVPSFARAMAERGAVITREDRSLQAWMGVPLMTGSRVLGVLALGSSAGSRPFSEDELRLLKDVGALAATSLDKARLFVETNLRARQLAALNDISRKLVAAELNLDNLLQLITQSACDILNAEAGAVLLLADDGSGDLEYRLSIGSIAEIVGKRVRAGEGILGEVASSGAVIYINEDENDPRLLAIRTGDGAPARSLLATPLVTQKRIIGVLEILNRVGEGFGKDDADLVTTFAGQAAVAIENARLFQLTDQQLRDRLEELETLERIDAEMNRSLDVEAVAEIALRYAMSETEATAGVIGLVDNEALRLDLVASVGYVAHDLGAGATLESWPLDSGIASRALKTHRAELVTDVARDPLFVPSLRDARAQITVPMMSGSDVIAMLILESNQEGKLHLADMPFVQRLAEHASIAIANAQLYAQLSRANQSKSEFVSFVAHELKNPLTSIKGYADVLVTGAVGGLSDVQRNFISTIRTNAERMNTLVSDLNDVTKLQTDNLSIQPEVVNLRELIEETLRPLQKQIDDKAQTVVLALDERVPDIFVDRNRLIQVLTNLLSNAYKYSPQETSITLRADTAMGKRDAQGVQKLMLHVAVQDQGIGMTEDDLNKLFTPYFRSENPSAREQPGTGLGLTITRGIIERHGGEIWVESQFGQGTTFHFTVPLPE